MKELLNKKLSRKEEIMVLGIVALILVIVVIVLAVRISLKDDETVDNGSFEVSDSDEITEDGGDVEISVDEDIDDKSEEVDDETIDTEISLKDETVITELDEKIAVMEKLPVIFYSDDETTVFSEIDQDSSDCTYREYVFDYGDIYSKYSDAKTSKGDCNGGAGFCYVVPISVVDSYSIKLFNIKSSGFMSNCSTIEDDKYLVYVGGGYVIRTIDVIGTISIKNVDNSDDIVYIKKYRIYEDDDSNNKTYVNVKYTFKLNSNNDYYLYSATRSKVS